MIARAIPPPCAALVDQVEPGPDDDDRHEDRRGRPVEGKTDQRPVLLQHRPALLGQLPACSHPTHEAPSFVRRGGIMTARLAGLGESSAPLATDSTSPTAVSSPSSRAITSARRAAPAASDSSSSAPPIASRSFVAEARRPSLTPAPAATTRAALSFWSRPSGNADHRHPGGERGVDGAEPGVRDDEIRVGKNHARGARTRGPRRSAAPGSPPDRGPGPVVTRPRTGSSPRAASVAPPRSRWSWKVVLKLASTSGRASSAGHGEVHSEAPRGGSTGPE